MGRTENELEGGGGGVQVQELEGEQVCRSERENAPEKATYKRAHARTSTVRCTHACERADDLEDASVARAATHAGAHPRQRTLAAHKAAIKPTAHVNSAPCAPASHAPDPSTRARAGAHAVGAKGGWQAAVPLLTHRVEVEDARPARPGER